ncbi:MAG: DUF4339 domain-containing protein [Planctomycetes bacterium]|nr:DUF4339 domain-containing protein [Planctomycetota bacterium]
MGIRFNCHLCNHPLHVKDFQANKRGKCPSCQGSFRVPSKSADYSIPLDPKLASSSGVLMPIPKSKSKRDTTGSSGSESEKVSITALEKASTQTDAAVTTKKGGQVAVDPTTASSSTKSTDAAAIPQTSDIPASLLPHIDARWFVRPPSGGQYGPATTPMLVDWIAERRITADSFLWREGMESWLSAVELIPERFGPIPVAPVSAASNTTITPANEVANELFREASPGSMASSKAAVTTKKKRQQREQWIVLGLLVTIAISLAAALIYLLWRS